MSSLPPPVNGHGETSVTLDVKTPTQSKIVQAGAASIAIAVLTWLTIALTAKHFDWWALGLSVVQTALSVVATWLRLSMPDVAFPLGGTAAKP